MFLRDEIRAYFKRTEMEVSVKYIDPSDTLRSMPADAHDSAFCPLLGHAVVRAGMSGPTDRRVGSQKGEEALVLIPLATSKRKTIDVNGWLWKGVLSTTGQSLGAT